jgi:hypothetical protein
VSKIRLHRGKSLNVPIKLEQRFDITGNEMEIQKFSDDTLQQIINPVKDYEVAKFIHDYDDYGNNDMFMAFSFLNDGGTWIDEYYPQGFTELELFKFSEAVKNSFFKLDFFDTPNRETQKLQFTKIIPMYLSNIAEYDKDKDNIPDYEDNDVYVDNDGDGVEETLLITDVEISTTTSTIVYPSGNQRIVYDVANEDEFIGAFTDRFGYSKSLGQNVIGTYIIPNFFSNSLKNNEINDLFIFKDLDTKPFNEFYVGCRFFNAKNGDVVRMTNDPIKDMGINPVQDYYYKVVLDREKRTYQIFDFSNGKVGDRVGHEMNSALMFYQML